MALRETFAYEVKYGDKHGMYSVFADSRRDANNLYGLLCKVKSVEFVRIIDVASNQLCGEFSRN